MYTRCTGPRETYLVYDSEGRYVTQTMVLGEARDLAFDYRGTVHLTTEDGYGYEVVSYLQPKPRTEVEV